MKKLFTLFILGAGLMFITACEKTEVTPLDNTEEFTQEFVVPEIPADIAAMMRPEDIERFKAGPGEEYLNAVRARSLYGHSRGPARWHPVMMHMEYMLQFIPIGGTSCTEFVPCFGMGAPTDPTEVAACLASQVGVAGQTEAFGKWLGSDIHAIYWPVFCLPDYAGDGSGFYEAEEGALWLYATNDPFMVDAEGNITFYRHGNYLPDPSTGIFSGAYGWETSIMYTAYENSPENNPEGIGFSDVITFGWVFF